MPRALLFTIALSVVAALGLARPLLAASSGLADGATDGSSWASLGQTAPRWLERSTTITGQAFTADPNDPRRIAYCAPEGIQATDDGGASWVTIPTTPVLAAAADSPNPLLSMGDVTPACLSAVRDPSAPSSVYATFRAGKAPFGAPPLVFVGYQSADSGESWQPIPTPDGVTMEQFGGVRVAGGAVQALFRVLGDAGAPSGFLVQQTVDGGQSWQAGALDCSDGVPCLRWGPAPNLIGTCSMAARIQPVERSDDGGQSFLPATLPSPFPGGGGGNACVLNELAGLDQTRALLLREDNPNPVELTEDGGHSWMPVDLPAFPDGAMQLARGLQLLPNGWLIARTQQADRWLALPAGGSAWLPIPAETLSAPLVSADTVQVIGDRLWWLENLDPAAPPNNATPTPRSVALDDLTSAVLGA